MAHNFRTLYFYLTFSLSLLSLSNFASCEIESSTTIPEAKDYYEENEIPDEEEQEDYGDKRIGFNLSNSKDDVEFRLFYDPDNPKRYDILKYDSDSSIKQARFKAGQPLKFITHGFMSSASAPNSTVPIIKNAYLSKQVPNVIGVDWSKLAKSESALAILSYVEVAMRVRIVGERIAEMIELLIDLKIISSPSDVHLVGHSLGAHVMGVTGYEVNKSKGKKVNRITGLDPAGPLFGYMKPENKLDPSDGEFVDVLHTDVGRFGSGEILGTVDFFANGGRGTAQPGCLSFFNTTTDMFLKGISGVCSHGRAYQLFGRSIRQIPPELYGCRCLIHGGIIAPTSCKVESMGLCRDKTLFGEYIPRTAKGYLYLDTHPASDIEFANGSNNE